MGKWGLRARARLNRSNENSDCNCLIFDSSMDYATLSLVGQFKADEILNSGSMFVGDALDYDSTDFLYENPFLNCIRVPCIVYAYG